MCVFGHPLLGLGENPLRFPPGNRVRHFGGVPAAFSSALSLSLSPPEWIMDGSQESASLPLGAAEEEEEDDDMILSLVFERPSGSFSAPVGRARAVGVRG